MSIEIIQLRCCHSLVSRCVLNFSSNYLSKISFLQNVFELVVQCVADARQVIATGFVAQAVGWPLFFLGTIVAAVPSLLLMVWLQRRGHFAQIERKPVMAAA